MPLLQCVIYATTGATLLDVSVVTLSAAAFPGCSNQITRRGRRTVHTATTCGLSQVLFEANHPQATPPAATPAITNRFFPPKLSGGGAAGGAGTQQPPDTDEYLLSIRMARHSSRGRVINSGEWQRRGGKIDALEDVNASHSSRAAPTHSHAPQHQHHHLTHTQTDCGDIMVRNLRFICCDHHITLRSRINRIFTSVNKSFDTERP